MRMLGRCLRYFAAAIALCFGSFAFAASAPIEYGYSLKHAFADAGSYGALSAKFTAEVAHQHAERTSNLLGSAGLVKASHGFMQPAADEVAKGTTGSTVSLYLS